jgi:hypothetical protein
MLSEERRCCREEGDLVGGEEISLEERRSRWRRGDLVGGYVVTKREISLPVASPTTLSHTVRSR